MNLPAISVVITTYNYGRFIEEAIDSVLSQDFPQELVQIVVVDDGSTDDTAERVKKYRTRVEYFHQSNAGQAAALNTGFARARGEIVVLLDADDVFIEGRLARVAGAFRQDPKLGMVYHGMVEWNMQSNERRESTFPLVSGDVKSVPDLFLTYVAQPTSCIAFRLGALSQLLPIPEHIRMLADGYLVDLIPFLSPILAIPEPLVVYRIHGANCFYTDMERVPPEVRKKTLQTRRVLVDAMRKWLADNGYTKRCLPVRVFLERWDLYLESEGFLIDAPNRLRFFWWRVRRNRTDSIRQTWRFTFFNYVTASFALVFGYANADVMYKWRSRILETTKRVYRKLIGQSEPSPDDF